jgi:hypothetical protein
MIWFPIGIVFVLVLWFAAGKVYDTVAKERA